MEVVDVLKESVADLLSFGPSLLPDQISFEGFKEGLDGGIVVAVPFSAH